MKSTSTRNLSGSNSIAYCLNLIILNHLSCGSKIVVVFTELCSVLRFGVVKTFVFGNIPSKNFSGPYDSSGHAVAQLVEALRHKSEVRGFNSRWCHWNFSLT